MLKSRTGGLEKGSDLRWMVDFSTMELMARYTIYPGFLVYIPFSDLYFLMKINIPFLNLSLLMKITCPCQALSFLPQMCMWLTLGCIIDSVAPYLGYGNRVRAPRRHSSYSSTFPLPTGHRSMSKDSITGKQNQKPLIDSVAI